MSEKTVIINGAVYNAQTGLPATPSKELSTPAAFKSHKQARRSQNVHQAVAKSHTLNRHTVKKPATSPATSRLGQTERSAAITKFAPHPTRPTRNAKMMDVSPRRPQPVLQRSMVAPKKSTTTITPAVVAPITPAAPAVKSAPSPQVQPVATQAPKLSQVIKQEAIDKAMAQPTKKASKRQKLAKKTAKRPRLLSIASASLALLLLGGYFTYLNMPSLSVRVAAAQSGVNATYPGYRPDGYSVNGLVTYDKGAVSMKFASNGGPQSFTIDQTKKNWDSSAVLENYVKPKAGGSYIPYSERGLTIYTFNNNAAWVNNGVFYTISGDAPLSSDQIRSIASSM